jgi:hypothetical protein
MFGRFQWSVALVRSALGQTKLFERSLLLWFFLFFFLYNSRAKQEV